MGLSAGSAEVDDMMTCANVLTLLGLSQIRFGGRGGGGGFAFLLFGLLIVGVVVWALTRPSESAKN
jgi:hypothetical protein